MKKIILTILISLLLVGTIAAGIGIGVGIIDRTRELPQDDLTFLNNLGIESYTVSKLECGSDYCEPIWVDLPNGRTLGVIDLIPYSMNEEGTERTYYTARQLNTLKDTEVDRIIRELIIVERLRLTSEENNVSSERENVTLSVRR